MVLLCTWEHTRFRQVDIEFREDTKVMPQLRTNATKTPVARRQGQPPTHPDFNLVCSLLSFFIPLKKCNKNGGGIAGIQVCNKNGGGTAIHYLKANEYTVQGSDGHWNTSLTQKGNKLGTPEDQSLALQQIKNIIGKSDKVSPKLSRLWDPSV